MPAVEEVIAVVLVADINIVRVIPVVTPISWPRVDQAEPVPFVLEAGEPADNHEWEASNPETVTCAEESAVTRLRDAVAVVSAALLPAPVIRLPVIRAMVLPGALCFLGALLLVVGFLRLSMLSVPILDLPRLLLSVLLRLTLGGRSRLLLNALLRLTLNRPWLLLSVLLLRLALGRSRLLLRFGLFVRALLRPRRCFLSVCMLLLGIGRSSNTEKY